MRMKRLGRIRQSIYGIGRYLASAAAGQALPPWDDYWYHGTGLNSSAGMSVSPETSMRLSAVFACIRVRSETLASLPLIVYERLPDGGKRRATNHPIYRLLHDSPNIWQTSLEFIEMMQGHLDLRGNAFARIVPGPRAAIDQLVPLHPDLVMVYRLADGRLQYKVRHRFQAEVDTFTQDEILHLRGLSSDGLVGLSPIALQRETLGNGLAMQDHHGRLMANYSVPPVVIRHPAKFKDAAAKERFRESWQKAQTDANRYKVAVLQDGMDITQLGLNNRDAQFLELQGSNKTDIASMFRVPPHKIGILDRATHSNVEQEQIEFVQECVRPMAVRWERRINLDLIDPLGPRWGNGKYFAEFNIDGLLRGDLKSRYEAYAVGRQWGWLSANDVRTSENMNPIDPDDGGDDYWRPVNIAIAGDPILLPSQPGAAALPAADDADDSGDSGNAPEDAAPADDEGEDAKAALKAQLYEMALEASKRVTRKETLQLRKSYGSKNDDEGFRLNGLEGFYAKHIQWAALCLGVDEKTIFTEMAEHKSSLFGVLNRHDADVALARIESDAPKRLASLILEYKLKAGKENAKANPD